MIIRYPSGGATIYPTFGDFPAGASQGALAVANDTDYLYVFDADTEAWILLDAPMIPGSVRFHAYRSSAGTLAPNNSNVQITCNSTLVNTNTCYDTTTFLFTAPVAGDYQFGGGLVTGTGQMLANYYQLVLYKNGAEYQQMGGVRLPATTLAAMINSTSGIITLAANDTVGLYLYGAGNNSAGAAISMGTSSFQTYFWGQRIA